MHKLDEKALAAARARWPEPWQDYNLQSAIEKAIAAYLASAPAPAPVAVKRILDEAIPGGIESPEDHVHYLHAKIERIRSALVPADEAGGQT